MMSKLLLVIILICFTSSCVTLFNRKNTHIYIRSTKGTTAVCHKEYIAVKTKKGIIHPVGGEEVPIPKKGIYVTVKRDRHQTIPVTVKKDNVEKTVYIKPVHSPMYYANFGYLYPFLSFGFLIDRKNPNRFGYPRSVYVDLTDTSDKHYYFFQPLRHMIKPFDHPYVDIDITPPASLYVINLNHFKPQVGPLGLSLTLNYHYARKNFLSLEAGAVAVAPFHIDGPRDSVYTANPANSYFEKKSGWFINVKNNRAILRRVELGYGLSFASYSGSIYRSVSDSMVYQRTDIGMGACASVYYRLWSFLSVGVNYQSQLLSFNNSPLFNYNYAMYAGVRFRF